MGEVSEGGFGQVAAFAVLPLFVLLEQDGADQAGDGLPVGEDLHDVGAALDLAVEALDGVVGPDLGPVLFGEGRKRGAALPGGAGQDRLDRGADTGVGVAGDQHDPLGGLVGGDPQSPLAQGPQEGRPKVGGLGVAESHAQDLATSLG